MESPAKDHSGTSAPASPSLHGRKSKGRNLEYQGLLEAGPDAILVVDVSRKIVLVNVQAEILFGYGRKELIGCPADILVSEHSRRRYAEQYFPFQAAGRENPSVVGLDLFGLRKDGSEFPAEIRLSPLDTKDRVLIISAIRDISGRRRTEEDLRRFASIVMCSDDAIIGKTLEGIITSWNAAAERMYGYLASEVIGKPVSMLVPINHPDEIPEILECLKRGEIVDHFETIRIRKSGEEFPIEITISPIRDAMERITGASIIGRDISERKRREQDLARLAAVVESSDDAIIGRLLDGTVTNWNTAAQRIYGYSASEIVGKPTSVLFSPAHLAEIAEMLEKIKRGEIVKRSDAIRMRHDGNELHVALTHTPIKNTEGRVIGISTVARDITESKRLEQQLRKVQKMESIGLLAGGIAHDINNLLSVILGYSEILLESIPHDSKMHSQCEEIKKAGDRAASLTGQLLAFSRQQALAPKILNLNEVVAETEKMLRRLIGENIDVRTTLDPTLGNVKADPGQIGQVIMNLVVNARDAMPEGGKLVIETSNAVLDDEAAVRHPPLSAGRYILLTVSDSGIGMDEETQTHIFEPFFTTKEIGKGTGLGLSTVYGVVKQSGGTVWVYSELGHGSVFKIYLPRVDEATLQSLPTELATHLSRGTETILLVEDEDSVRKLTQSLLEDAGYKVIEARSGDEALEVTARNSGPIHLLLSDIVMPGMNGPDLGERLAVTNPEMKILYMSGYTSTFANYNKLIDRCVKLIQKPFSRPTLLRTLREVLESPVEVQPT